MFSKNDFKMTLIISFIVLEILSMLFNSFFSEYHLFGRTIIFNYSIVFFSLAFFIVDLMNDFFSSKEAEKFFFYKVYSQGVLPVSLRKINFIYFHFGVDRVFAYFL